MRSKNPQAVALANKRWKGKTKEEKSAYGKKMAKARWGKKGGRPKKIIKAKTN